MSVNVLISFHGVIFPDGNQCSDAPCLNGGTCVDAGITYFCNCVPGFSGMNCEQNISKEKKRKKEFLSISCFTVLQHCQGRLYKICNILHHTDHTDKSFAIC